MRTAPWSRSDAGREIGPLNIAFATGLAVRTAHRLGAAVGGMANTQQFRIL